MSRITLIFLSITVLLLCTSIKLSEGKKVKYVNWIPFNGVNCTGLIVGHGTSYLLDACIPFEWYSLKYSVNTTSSTVTTQYWWDSTNCSTTPDVGSPSNLNQCYRFRMGDRSNPYFYSYATATRKPVKAPIGEVSLYHRSYRQSDDECEEKFLWSKYVTNGTNWNLLPTLREYLYCDPTTFHPIEKVCNTTTWECQITDRYSDCGYFEQQTAWIKAKCVDYTTSAISTINNEDEEEDSNKISVNHQSIHQDDENEYKLKFRPESLSRNK